MVWVESQGLWQYSDFGEGDKIDAVNRAQCIYALYIKKAEQPPRDILEEALAITNGDRAADYGDMKASFERIAALWSAYKGVTITTKDVANMMILLKVSRSTTSDKRDNWVDIAGYARCGSIVS
jgi:hypothetical protein